MLRLHIVPLDESPVLSHLQRSVQAPKGEYSMSSSTVAVTDASFATDVLGSKGLVLVDFWAEWCGPCKAIGPALEEIGKELAGKVTVAKVNIDDNPETPNAFAVTGIPTLILFKDGKPVSKKVGAAPKSVLKQWVEASL
jgi:thioredoxin 1